VALNFLLPALEYARQSLNGVVVVGLLARVHGLDLLKDRRVDLVELNLVVERLEGFSELLGKLVESLLELFLLVVFAGAPLLFGKLLNEWLVHVVDDGVEG